MVVTGGTVTARGDGRVHGGRRRNGKTLGHCTASPPLNGHKHSTGQPCVPAHGLSELAPPGRQRQTQGSRAGTQQADEYVSLSRREDTDVTYTRATRSTQGGQRDATTGKQGTGGELRPEGTCVKTETESPDSRTGPDHGKAGSEGQTRGRIHIKGRSFRK